MPEELERKLWYQVNRDHPTWSDERKRAYVYGAMRKTGWVPSHQRNAIKRRAHKK
jgi:hypothetical protein